MTILLQLSGPLHACEILRSLEDRLFCISSEAHISGIHLHQSTRQFTLSTGSCIAACLTWLHEVSPVCFLAARLRTHALQQWSLPGQEGQILDSLSSSGNIQHARHIYILPLHRHSTPVCLEKSQGIHDLLEMWAINTRWASPGNSGFLQQSAAIKTFPHAVSLQLHSATGKSRYK